MKTSLFSIFLVLMIFSTELQAEGRALTVYGGYRDGGAFTETQSEKSLPLAGAGAASLALDLPYDQHRQYQIFVSHQETTMSLAGLVGNSGNDIRLNITYLHVGGTNFFTGPVGEGLYMVGGIGATWFDHLEHYDSELRLSLNLGFGYQYPVARALAVRVEARGYATLVNSSGGLFCSGGCVVSISGDTITQGDLMFGLSAQF